MAREPEIEGKCKNGRHGKNAPFSAVVRVHPCKIGSGKDVAEPRYRRQRREQEEKVSAGECPKLDPCKGIEP